MTAFWIVVGLGVAAAAVVLLAVRRRRSSPADLGVVSSQWIAEQRVTQDAARRR